MPNARKKIYRPNFVPRNKTPTFNVELTSFKGSSTDEDNQSDHLMPISNLAAKLNSNLLYGLTDEYAAKMLEIEGPNLFTPPKTRPEIFKFLGNLLGGFSILMWVAAFLCLLAYVVQGDINNIYIAIAISTVVTVTGSLSYYQEASSSRVLESFKNMVPQKATVIRAGQRRIISAADLVVGDLVEIRSGDRIPADLRLVSGCEQLKVDNSALTGESEPIIRRVDPSDEDPLKTQNLLFSSTNCVEGSGTGIVIRTGDASSMGQIVKMVGNVAQQESTLSKEVKHFVTIITAFAVLMGFSFFIASFLLGCSIIDALMFLVGLIVSNVPEGLLPALTVSLALTAKRMVKKNCLVKHLEAVETLGSTSVICSDKTGTLTQNQMTVAHVWLNKHLVPASHSRQVSESLIKQSETVFRDVIRCCALCSRTTFLPDQDDVPILKRKCNGDASESAILRYVESAFFNVEQFRLAYPKIYEKPFNSTYKFQWSVHELPSDNNNEEKHYLVCLKGAPERVFDFSSTMLLEDGLVVIDDQIRVDFLSAYKQMGGLGERVIGLCDCLLSEREWTNMLNSQDFTFKNLRFIGLIGMIDPPRPSVPDAVQKCRAAGVKVTMVTGDHPITAKAIARQVGIFTADSETAEDVAERLHIPIEQVNPNDVNAAVISGDDLVKISEEELRHILTKYPEIVFARTSPQQKLAIVEAYQSLGMVVAVTGDGVNDSAALKKADIGVAMGITGSDVSKEAADMILLDDNFSTIVCAIEEGRLIFENLKKVAAYSMAGNASTILPCVVYIALGYPLGMSVIVMLLITLGTDMLPSISLAYESSENDLMTRAPRNPQKDKLVNFNLLLKAYLQIGFPETAAGYLMYIFMMGWQGFLPHRLYQIRLDWERRADNSLEDSYGQEWTYAQRKMLERDAQCALFVAIVVCQWADVIICKCRRMSVFTKGFRNNVLNFALIFETALLCFFLYTPGVNMVLQLAPMSIYIWLYSLPAAIFFFCTDELRRLFMRLFPQALGQAWLS